MDYKRGEKMDYFRQRRAYRNFKQNEADISMGQNNLYRELLDYANDEGKLDDWFPLKNSALIDLTGLSTQGVVKARNGLIQMNLIDYKPGQKNTKKPQYKIIQLYKQTLKSVTTSVTTSVTEGVTKQPKCNNQLQSSVTTGSLEVSQLVVQPVEQTVEHKDLTSTRQRLDKDQTVAASKRHSLASFQELWLFPNVVQQEALFELIGLYGDELVNAAIKVAGSKDVTKKNAMSFITACLKEWADENVKTLDQAREYQRKRPEQRKNKFSRQQPIRQETMPDWEGKQTDEPLSPEEQAEFQRQIDEFTQGM